MKLIFAFVLCLLLYVRITKKFAPPKDNALCVAVCALALASAMYDVWLLVSDVMVRHYFQAGIDVVCFLSNAFLFSVYWYKLDIHIYRSGAGVISEDAIWVFMVGPYMYTHESLLKLGKQVVTQWCDDRHLVG